MSHLGQSAGSPFSETIAKLFVVSPACCVPWVESGPSFLAFLAAILFAHPHRHNYGQVVDYEPYCRCSAALSGESADKRQFLALSPPRIR